MSEQRPEVAWIFPPERPRRGPVVLSVVLVIAALAIAALLVFLLFPRDATAPSPTGSPTATPTRTPAASPSPTAPLPTKTPSPTPSASEAVPTTDPLPPEDPDVATFRSQVDPRLGDAQVGLDLLTGRTGTEAVEIVDQLQQDAQRLSDAAAPGALLAPWREAVASYAGSLSDLRRAADSGGDVAAGISSARQSLDDLRRLLGS